MGNQLAEVEGHVHPGVGLAKQFAVEVNHQGQVQLAVLPGIAQLVGRDGHGAEGAGRFALEKAKTLGQFCRNQVAQRYVIDQHHQPDGLGRFFGRGTQGHVAGDDGDFGLHVNAPGLFGHDGRARGDEAVAAALVHQRVGVEGLGHLGVAGAAHQLDVVEVGRAIGPLPGARQRAVAGGLVKRLAFDGAAVQRFVHLAQLRLHRGPVVHRGQQGAGNGGHGAAAAQVAADDDQGAVAAALLQGGKFHGVGFPLENGISWRSCRRASSGHVWGPFWCGPTR